MSQYKHEHHDAILDEMDDQQEPCPGCCHDCCGTGGEHDGPRGWIACPVCRGSGHVPACTDYPPPAPWPSDEEMANYELQCEVDAFADEHGNAA